MFRSPLLADCIAIAIGGAVGALLRHAITRLSASIPGGFGPLGTTVVNVFGCFAIGLLAGFVVAGGPFPERHQLAVRTGFLGSLTTFSTFALESIQYGYDQRWMAATLYVSANLLLGFAAVIVGMTIGRSLAPTQY